MAGVDAYGAKRGSADPLLLASSSALSSQEKKHYIQAMVRYVLFNESHRRILKREDIVKNGGSLC